MTNLWVKKVGLRPLGDWRPKDAQDSGNWVPLAWSDSKLVLEGLSQMNICSGQVCAHTLCACVCTHRACPGEGVPYAIQGTSL